MQLSPEGPVTVSCHQCLFLALCLHLPGAVCWWRGCSSSGVGAAAARAGPQRLAPCVPAGPCGDRPASPVRRGQARAVQATVFHHLAGKPGEKLRARLWRSALASLTPLSCLSGAVATARPVGLATDLRVLGSWCVCAGRPTVPPRRVTATPLPSWGRGPAPGPAPLLGDWVTAG